MNDILIQAASTISAISIITAVVVSNMKKYLCTELCEIKKTVKDMDYNHCKTHLTEFLADIKCGVCKSDVQMLRAYEVYEHYVKDLNGNSYICDEWNKIIKKER